MTPQGLTPMAGDIAKSLFRTLASEGLVFTADDLRQAPDIGGVYDVTIPRNHMITRITAIARSKLAPSISQTH